MQDTNIARLNHSAKHWTRTSKWQSTACYQKQLLGTAKGQGQDKIHYITLKWIRIIRRRVWEEWRCKGTCGRVMRELSSLGYSGGEWLSRKARREGSCTPKAYMQGQKWRRFPATEKKFQENWRREECLQKAATWLTPFSGYIKGFVSRGLNKCY